LQGIHKEKPLFPVPSRYTSSATQIHWTLTTKTISVSLFLITYITDTHTQKDCIHFWKERVRESEWKDKGWLEKETDVTALPWTCCLLLLQCNHKQEFPSEIHTHTHFLRGILRGILRAII
jgi:hypothetical protein